MRVSQTGGLALMGMGSFAMLVHAYWRARKARALSPPRG
jgi:hypothetical protein